MVSLILLTNLLLPAPAEEWELVLGGDIMLNGVNPARTGLPMLGKLVPSGSVFYANLEVPLTNSRTKTSLKSAAELKAKSQFILKADPAHAANLAKARIDVVSLGNNHAMDYGINGIRQTQAVLSKNAIRFCGAGENLSTAREIAVVKTKGGMRIGFFSSLSFLGDAAMAKCGPAGAKRPGISTLTVGGRNGKPELTKLRALVKTAKAKCDFLVVCPHWGTEKMPLPREYQVSLGRLWIEAGADAVIGNHPHVVQPAETYRGKPILYSLGNLVGPGKGATEIVRIIFTGSKIKSANPAGLTYAAGSLKQRRITPAELDTRWSAFQRKFPNKASTRLY